MIQIKKIALSFFKFAVISIAIYVLVLYLLVNIKVTGKPLVYRLSSQLSWKGGNTYEKFIDFNPNKKYDVIVIGSSHAYRGYDPRIFKSLGLDMFNLGTSGQTPLNTYFIAQDYLSSNSCKLVILDVYDGSFSVDGLESGSDLIQNLNSNSTALKMAIALKNPAVINMLSVRMLSENMPPMYLDSNYAGNGYSEKKDSVKEINMKAYQNVFSINRTQRDYFEKLLEFFKKQNMNVIVVTHPAPLESSRESHKGISNMVSAICKKNNVLYFDYSFSHHLDSKNYFYDSHHLNQAGVNYFDEKLIKDLKDKKIVF